MGKEEEEEEKTSRPQFLEVFCSSSGKFRRFAAGTKAGFALYLINSKLEVGVPPALHIESLKEGEEPVSFGPNATLVNYGKDWKLQTATDKGCEEMKEAQKRLKKFPIEKDAFRFRPVKEPINGSSSTINFQYILKMLLVFVFIFLLGGSLTLFLENLPNLLLRLSSS